jgi:peptidoglycan/xylan/chitin deacetylase (PgdA/CDA1 family)
MYWHKTPSWLRKFYPTFTWRRPTAENTLYLTFDDGPIPGMTEWVLDQLAQYQIKATFFCVGDNVRKNPEVFSWIRKQGHATGNHTFNHLNGWKTPADEYVRNTQFCQKFLTNEKQLFRPPYGKISRKQATQLQQHGYEIIMWDVLSGDFDRKLSPEKCLAKTIEATESGSIIVFHDNVKAEERLTHVLPRYIEHFLEKGFAFETLA